MLVHARYAAPAQQGGRRYVEDPHEDGAGGAGEDHGGDRQLRTAAPVQPGRVEEGDQDYERAEDGQQPREDASQRKQAGELTARWPVDAVQGEAARSEERRVGREGRVWGAGGG